MQLDGYQLQAAGSADSAQWDLLADIPLTSAVSTLLEPRLHFSFVLSDSGLSRWYRVVPYHDAAEGLDLGIASTPVYFGFDQLLPPANLSASQGEFDDRVELSWEKSPQALGYRVFHDQQDNMLTQLGDVDSYVDTTLSDTLPHLYWVQALDSERTSNLGNQATGWLKPPVTDQQPPTGVSASDGAFGDHVHITWDKAAGAVNYELYRDNQSSLLATLGDVSNYDDYALADSFPHTYWVLAVGAGGERSVYSNSDTGYRLSGATGEILVLAYNDLGMHCMNQDFSELMILPPFNTLHAQLIDRSGEEPRIVQSGVTVKYNIAGNTYSVGKTNFWDFENLLFGVDLAPNVGLTGHGLSGEMVPSGGGHTDWQVTGIPVTPLDDELNLNPYPLATVTVFDGTQELGHTQAVVPVSWEISCNLCHGSGSISPETAILRSHDSKHGTDLEHSKPVVCGTCHAQPELGMPGSPEVDSLSSVMHSAHAARMGLVDLENSCYACHPGLETQCFRDVHYSAGMTCVDCHGDMADVGNPLRQPWADEPRCDDCHSRTDFEFEQPGVLYRDSLGHHGLQCAACHGSPHAVTPTVITADNLQAIATQGYPGVINKCEVCHQNPPQEFEHFFEANDE